MRGRDFSSAHHVAARVEETEGRLHQEHLALDRGDGGVRHVDPRHLPSQGLSHTKYQLNGFKKSTPPQNLQPIANFY